MALIIGDVTLDGFEISGSIRFGGRQALVIHRLPGGGRVIDAQGPDDSDIVWNGILTGSDGADRARVLDGLRRSGATVALAWDSFLVAVVVAELVLEFLNPWWIPYRIRCVVAPGMSATAGGGTSSLELDILTDIGVAANFVDIGATAVALNATGALVGGTSAYAAAYGALAGLSASIDASIATAELGVPNDIPGLLVLTASLANLCAARGYVARAGANFQLSGS